MVVCVKDVCSLRDGALLIVIKPLAADGGAARQCRRRMREWLAHLSLERAGGMARGVPGSCSLFVSLLTRARPALTGRVGLDVFEDEPDMKPGLAECENAVIVPHIASASLWTRSGMVRCHTCQSTPGFAPAVSGLTACGLAHCESCNLAVQFCSGCGW